MAWSRARRTAVHRPDASKLKSDLQPTVYLYALKMLRREDILFRWDVLVKNKTPVLIHYPAERTEDDFHRLVELIKLMQEMIDSGHFIPNEGSHFCPGCGFHTACRAWHLNPDYEPAAVGAGS